MAAAPASAEPVRVSIDHGVTARVAATLFSWARHSPTMLAAAACLAGLALAVRAADADPASSAGEVFRMRSMRELRDSGVVRQQHDYSCGAAALATLLSYGLDDPVDESALLGSLFANLGAADFGEIKQRGLSLSELQGLAERRGLKAQGFRLAATQLGKISRPVIAFVRPGGYRHFVVLRGVRNGRVWIADPSAGNVRMPLDEFLAEWAEADGRGIVFVVDRADHRWPQDYPLRLGPGPVVRPQAEAALDLIDDASRISVPARWR